LITSNSRNDKNYFLPPLDPPEVLGGLFPLPPPDGFPVVLGAFFTPLDLLITVNFKMIPTSV
jgi:hypothetical protein